MCDTISDLLFTNSDVCDTNGDTFDTITYHYVTFAYLMLTADLHPIFAARGIAKPFPFLRKAGFSHNTAHRLLNNPGALRVSYIERLCTVLNCTPDDLFTYTPAVTDTLLPDHQLRKLIRQQSRGSLTEELIRLSPGEINKLWSIIDDLKSGHSSEAQ